jgi:hypothetical protein
MAIKIGELLIKLGADVAGLKTDMSAAAREVKRASNEIKSAADLARNALATIGVGLSVGAIVNSLRATVDEMAALDDAAEKTGASVESLSSLLNTLKPSGVGLDTLTNAMGKLVKSMIGADVETSKAAKAFDILGIAIDPKNLPDPAETFERIAVELSKYEDGANKTALAQALFGKSGAELLPILKDLAATTRVTSSVTTAQAAAAEELQKSIGRLGVEFDRFKVSFLGPVVDKLTDLITEFNLGRDAAGGFWSAVLRYGIGFAPEDPAVRVEQARSKLAELRAQLDRDQAIIDTPDGAVLGRGARTRAATAAAGVKAQIEVAEKDLKYFSQLKAMNDRKDPTLRSAEDRGFDPTRPRGQAPGGLGGDGDKEADRAAEAAARARIKIEQDGIDEIRKIKDAFRDDEIADITAAARRGEISEREAIDRKLAIQVEYLAETARLAEQEIATLQAVDGKLRDPAAIEAAAAKRRAVELDLLMVQREASRERLALWAEEQRAAERAAMESARSRGREIESLRTTVEAMEEENKARNEALWSGRELNEILAERLVLRLREQLARDERPDPRLLEELRLRERELELLRERNTIAKVADQKTTADKEAEKAIERAQEKADRMEADISKSLTDALLRGFENGKGFAENFRDTLRNMFMSLILRPVIEPVVKPIAEGASKGISALIDAGLSAVVGSFSGVSAEALAAMPDESLAETSRLARSATPRANGGPTVPGGTYLVGEEGPEVLKMGSVGGSITPNAATRTAQRSVNITQVFNLSSDTRQSEAVQYFRAAKDLAKAEIRDEIARNDRTYG